MAGSNGYANLVRKKGKRRKLDDYETPPNVTRALCDHVRFKGPILEPAAGSQRMARELGKHTGVKKIYCQDIKWGKDFLKRTERWPGDIVTNPPYRDGLAEAFVEQALRLADGKVAMLMELKFLTTERRRRNFFGHNFVDLVIVIPWRINFIAGGKPIPSQFFNHCWIVWPDRKTRMLSGRHNGGLTRIVWAEDDSKIFG